MPRHSALRRPAFIVALVVALVAGIAPSSATVIIRAADPPRSVELEVTWTRPGSDGQTFAPPAALRVGDEVTATPTLIGFEVFGSATCVLTFSRGAAGAAPLVRAMMASDMTPDCAAWTFVVPPTPTGLHTLSLFVVVGEFERYDPSFALTVELGGLEQPFTSNAPLLTWDVQTLFGDDRLRFGDPWTFAVPPNAEYDCSYTINGSYLTGLRTSGDATSCTGWTVRLPDIRPPALRSIEPNGYPWQVGFVGEWWRSDDARRTWGHMVTGEVLVDDATDAVEFTSSRPAAVFAADDNPYFAYPGAVSRIPRVVGVDAGTCVYDVKQPNEDSMPFATVAIVDGGCPAIEFDVVDHGAFQAYVYIKDTEGKEVAAAWTGGEIILPMPEPEIDIPPVAKEGEPVEIDASTGSGSPLEWEITTESETATAGYATAAVAPVACEGASGTFLLADADRSATATCTFPAPGTYRVTATFRDPIGTERQTSTTIEIAPDTTVPTITNLRQRLVPGSQLGTSAVPVQIAWTASDGGSGVEHVEVARQTDGGPWVVIDGNTTASSITRDQYRGHRYRFRVRAVDGAGNVSAWSYTATFGPTVHSESNPKVRYTGAWSTASSVAAYGGAMRSTTRAGASASITFTGRSVAWVAPTSAVRGRAKVYLDGVYKGRVDLGAVSLTQRRAVFAWNWATRGTHTLRIVNEATSGRVRIDLDAIVVLD